MPSVPALVYVQVAVVPDCENWPLVPHGDAASAEPAGKAAKHQPSEKQHAPHSRTNKTLRQCAVH